MTRLKLGHKCDSIFRTYKIEHSKSQEFDKLKPRPNTMFLPAMVSAWIATNIVKGVFDILNAPTPPTDEEEGDFLWMKGHFKKQKTIKKRIPFTNLNNHPRSEKKCLNSSKKHNERRRENQVSLFIF